MTSRNETVTFSFPLADLQEQVDAFAQLAPQAVADRRGYSFVAAGTRLRLPLRGLLAAPGESVAAYGERLRGHAPETLDVQWLLLVRAGAVALGGWAGDRCFDHKALRAYVVRGNGRAQPTYLESRGKSRYGSRLRLQNWQRLLVDTGERLALLRERGGEPSRLFVAIPVRVAADLWSCATPPPFARGDARLVRLPLHVHRPDHDELWRVWHWLGRGELHRAAPPA